MATSPIHGVVVGKLNESHPAWIVVGGRLLFLRAGESCHYQIGTILHVFYIEQDGQSAAQIITPISAAR